MEQSITYEHLFNLGNFEHEKFSVTVELRNDEPWPDAMKALVIQVIGLEEECSGYRSMQALRRRLVEARPFMSADRREEADGQIAHVDRAICAFREKHRPLDVECKCRYCRHPDGDDEQGSDGNAPH